LEADKEVVRLLLDRYGWINRDIVNRERLPSAQSSSTFRWRHAFRALRVMELSGEVMTGQFFEQLATPQFISASALSSLQQRSNLNTTAETSWWVAANDPISPCGLGLDWPELPQRRANNYLSFTGDQLTAVFEHSGKHLHYYIDPDSEGFELTNASLVHLVNYRRLHVRIETINQQPARQSPYLAGLARQFQTAADHKSVTLQPPF
jgi:ATP-dependent Lhr-like helicase